ncbi:Protein of uncharacterised function (DUF3618) [Corynebacterium urealyticum]|nr:Protein of uncharacterised function (DUF3618) [Corynebacterium urealyticum]
MSVARSIDAIERDIERTRNQLAKTLDELAFRADPKNLADDARGQVSDFLREPKVQMVLGGVAAGVVLLVAATVSSKRKEKKQVREIQRLLASTR